jgi:hypothetical protein
VSYADTDSPRPGDLLAGLGGPLAAVAAIPLALVLGLLLWTWQPWHRAAAAPALPAVAAPVLSATPAPVRSATDPTAGPSIASAKPSSTSPAALPSAATDPADQAQAIGDVLARMHTQRQAVATAVDDASACGQRSGLDADAAALRQAADDRRALVSEVQNLAVNQIPGADAVVRTTVAALQSSADADEDLARWVDMLQSGTCRPAGATAGPQYQTAMASGRRADRDKQALVAAWNPVAGRYGLPTYQETDL